MKNLALIKKIKNISYTTQFSFIFLTILDRINSTANSIDLSVVCDIRNGRGDINLINLPKMCTSAGTSFNNINVLDEMAQTNSSVPLILKYNKFTYLQWGDHLDRADAFVTLMEHEKLSGIIFNNMYKVNFDKPAYDPNRNVRIYNFFATMKDLNPDGIYGLAIPKHAELLPTAFNYALLDDVVDFYVIKTINYRKCKWNVIMSRTTTVGDMRKSLKNVPNIVPMSKILLTVQLYAEGITPFAKNGSKIISYSEMCGAKRLGEHRKYCKHSLKTLWKMGNLRYLYKMRGFYIEFVDYDDIYGYCECLNSKSGYNTSFPGLSAINSGSQNTADAIDLGCKDFGDIKDEDD